MVVPWQVIGGIAGLSIAFVGLGLSVLRLTPPDFRAGRGWFWSAALWMMVWSAAAYLETDRSIIGACIQAAVEVTALVLLIVGLRWVGSRERLHAEAATVPDVSLDMVPPSSLVLTTSEADAFDIQIDSISTGDSVHSYLDGFPIPGRGKVSGVIKTKATRATFPFTPVVRVGKAQPLTPSVQDQLLPYDHPLTIQEFMERKFNQRRVDELREFVDAERLDRPIEAKVMMVYCNKPRGRKGRRCWRKTETLHYDPRQTPPLLHVRHAGEPTELAELDGSPGALE